MIFNTVSNEDLKKVNTKIETKADKSELGTILTGTLTAGQTSITLSNSAITTDSTIDPYTSVYGVNPINITLSSGRVLLEFDAQESDLNVKVRVS